jgi:hypothetical protein
LALVGGASALGREDVENGVECFAVVLYVNGLFEERDGLYLDGPGSVEELDSQGVKPRAKDLKSVIGPPLEAAALACIVSSVVDHEAAIAVSDKQHITRIKAHDCLLNRLTIPICHGAADLVPCSTR